MTQTQLHDLEPHAADMARRALEWTDQGWDEAAALFRVPSDVLYERGHTGGDVHLVRETAWYALGLLLRNAPDDSARAVRAVDRLLDYQFDEPGRPYHGTWYRSPAEPPPPAEPTVWRDYDPNWREFIGTTLAVMLLEYRARLPAALIARIDTALRRAIAGTLARNVPASYTNIALMTAFLLDFGAERLGEPAWTTHAERLAAEILERFRAGSTFDEYNSPTYYGVDLYALALWRTYASSSLLREAGAQIEATLWRDIAQFYHAGMRNVAGPYDRSYGMDMRSYVAGLGMWIWPATGHRQAPFPDLERPLAHGWDFVLAPLIALLGLQMPDDARPHFLAFQGERHLERLLAAEPHRVASAWIGERVMLGAEDSSSRHRVNEQYHPVTVHWLIGDHELGWIRLRHGVPVDATAERNRLAVSCTEHGGGRHELVFEIAAPGVAAAELERERWRLPGLTVRVDTEAEGPLVSGEGDVVQLRYAADVSAQQPIRFVLTID